MDFIQATALGIVQGASEFLPISSSAHLILTPWLFNFPDPGLAFDVALHAGTLIAVVIYFRRDWINIFRIAFLKSEIRISKSETNSKSEIQNSKLSTSPNYKLQITNYNKNILWLLVLATIPGVLAGYFLEDYAETVFRSPLLIAFTLSFVGLLLYLADKYHKHIKKIKEVSWRDSLVIGLSQALAIIPGVSRSGATITAGLFCGLNRQSAARFSFLLSTPIILGATVKQLPGIINGGFSYLLLLAVIASSISGYFAIKYLLKLVERAGYAVFFWYRLGLAMIVVLSWINRS